MMRIASRSVLDLLQVNICHEYYGNCATPDAQTPGPLPIRASRDEYSSSPINAISLARTLRRPLLYGERGHSLPEPWPLALCFVGIDYRPHRGLSSALRSLQNE